MNRLPTLTHFLRARLFERSTWRGVALLLTALGISLDPAHLEALLALGSATIGALEVLQPDPEVRMDVETLPAQVEETRA